MSKFEKYILENYNEVIDNLSVNLKSDRLHYIYNILFPDSKEEDIDNLYDFDNPLEIYNKLYIEELPEFGTKEDILREIIEANFKVNKYDFMSDYMEDMICHMIGYNDPAKFFKDLSYGGCESGLVGMLIYNSDCKTFYIDHIDDLESYMDDMNNELDEVKFENKDNLPHYTYVCWTCYEIMGSIIGAYIFD